jgi:pyruvate dehydrogenase E1 component beta subunit
VTTQTTPTQATTTSTRTTYREALRAAIREALLNDERVFLMGEDVGSYGGAHGVSLGLLEEFGPDRIRDAPLSENAFTGAGIGAALGGMRPIVEIMTVNFSLLALDQIVNNAAALLHMSGGQCSVPLVIRMTTGAGRQLAAQHSHSLEAWYAHIPGIRVVAPATLADARGMLATALADPDPVVIFEHGSLYNMEGELATGASAVDIERAAVRRHGDDVTIVAYGGTLRTALDAAEQLAAEGIKADVVDLRTLRPLDDATVLDSVQRTHRAVVVDEGWRSVGLAAEVSERITEQAFYELDAPVARVCSAEVSIPYPRHLEQAAIPSVDRVLAAARGVMGTT